MDHAMKVKTGITAAIAMLTALWGWFGWLCVAWIACMAVDYISGTVAAMRDASWSSKVARDGIFHKGGMVLTVFVALLFERCFFFCKGVIT